MSSFLHRAAALAALNEKAARLGLDGPEVRPTYEACLAALYLRRGRVHPVWTDAVDFTCDVIDEIGLRPSPRFWLGTVSIEVRDARRPEDRAVPVFTPGSLLWAPVSASGANTGRTGPHQRAVVRLRWGVTLTRHGEIGSYGAAVVE